MVAVSDGGARVDGPGWVDHSSDPIMGLFPIAVEQFINAQVAINAPGVTTVTSAARYYALHGVVADEAHRRSLTTDEARRLLRRVEVVYALVCMAHEESDEHPSWAPAAHGRDRLLKALGSGKVDVDEASGTGSGRYANASWGFLAPYRGSEVFLGILANDGSFAPGGAYDRGAVRDGLGHVLELAKPRTRLDRDDVAGLGSLCLCRATSSADGEWLASRFAGRAGQTGSNAANLGQTMQLLATAMRSSRISGLSDLGRFVMYDPVVMDHPQSNDMWLRWRGLRLRMVSVSAWRDLFAHVCKLLDGGPQTIETLGQALADQLPDRRVSEIVDSLPPVRDDAGRILPAENEIAELAGPEGWLMLLFLGGLRYRALSEPHDPVRLGFAGPPMQRFEVEELSPHWVATMLDLWASRPVRDVAADLVRVMVNRAHRVTMAKSYYRRRDGRFVMPLRIMLHDDFVIRVHPETTGDPSLRWAQLLSMGRQTGLFTRNEDGVWEVGARGHVIG